MLARIPESAIVTTLVAAIVAGFALLVFVAMILPAPVGLILSVAPIAAVAVLSWLRSPQ
jgi:hypothetical protein